MRDWTPFDLLEQRFDRNRNIGENKDRKGESIQDFFHSAAMDIVPFRNGGQDAECVQDQIVIRDGSGDRAQRYG